MNLRTLVLGPAVVATAGLNSYVAQADSQLDRLIKNPSNWAAQAGDYANHRYSTLNQINEGNVGKLQVAWTISTGVLRGHEGSPLVIGETMYLHSPFPNKVIAINLKDQTFIWQYEPKQDTQVVSVMCCDTVNRGLAYARRQDLPAAGRHERSSRSTRRPAKCVWTAQNGDPEGRRNQHQRAARLRRQGASPGISGGEFGVRGCLIAYDIKTRQAGVEGLFARAPTTRC